MITLRKNKERHHVRRRKHDIWHTFYPRDHPDPLANGFGGLALFEEARIPPRESTVPPPGDGKEIVTYVCRGALAQDDPTGNSGVIHAGEFQRMTAGRGVRPKETNASRSDWAHVFRISLRPPEISPDHAREHARFTTAQRHNMLCVVASLDGRQGSLRIRQDALIYSSILDPGRHLVHELLPGRSAWLHIVYGEATLDDVVLTQGDGVGVTSGLSISVTVQENTEILLVDLGPEPRSHLEAETSCGRPAREDHGDRKTTVGSTLGYESW